MHRSTLHGRLAAAALAAGLLAGCSSGMTEPNDLLVTGTYGGSRVLVTAGQATSEIRLLCLRAVVGAIEPTDANGAFTVTGTIPAHHLSDLNGAAVRVMGRVSADRDTLVFDLEFENTRTHEWLKPEDTERVAVREASPDWSGASCPV